MAEKRIKIAKDKASLVESLADSNTGPFETYADVMIFAASLGVKKKYSVPLDEIAKKPEAIRQDIFDNRGYDNVINLLAISHTKDIKILSSDEECESDKIRIFEEYANGGLEILEGKLKGSVDYLEQILLILSAEINSSQTVDREFDLSDLLPM